MSIPAQGNSVGSASVAQQAKDIGAQIGVVAQDVKQLVRAYAGVNPGAVEGQAGTLAKPLNTLSGTPGAVDNMARGFRDRLGNPNPANQATNTAATGNTNAVTRPTTATVNNAAGVPDYLRTRGITLDKTTTGSQNASTMTNAMETLHKGVQNGEVSPQAALGYMRAFLSPDGGYQFKLASKTPENNAYVPVARELGRLANDPRLSEQERRTASGTADNLFSQFDPRSERTLLTPMQDAYRAGRAEPR
jgi:hypothetical protein